MCVCVCVCIYICVCVCVCAPERREERAFRRKAAKSCVSHPFQAILTRSNISPLYLLFSLMWSFDEFGPYVRPLPSRVKVDPTNTCAGPLPLSLTISFSPCNLVAFSCLSHFFSSPSAVHFVNGDVHLRRTHSHLKECGKSLGDSFVSYHTHIHKHPTTICAHQGARFRILSPSSVILTVIFHLQKFKHSLLFGEQH